MHVRRIWIVIVAGVSLSTALFGIPVPPPDLDGLTEASTLIVVGQLTSVGGNIRADTVDLNYSRINVHIRRGTFRIDQILKGDAPTPSFTFEFAVPDDLFGLGWSIPRENTYGLFFFKETSGTLGFTDVYYTWIPVPRSISVTADTPLERVTKTLGEVLLVPDSSRAMKERAIFFLDFGRSDASLHELRGALTNADPAVGVNAARALMFKGDASGLLLIKRVFLPGPQSLPNGLEETVPNAISNISDPKLIPDLEELQNSSSSRMRRGVVVALTRTGSPEAVRGLRRAIADPDFEVRYYGVLGLGRITDGDGAMLPQMEQFKADEIKYVSYWRERSVKRELQTAPRNRK